MRINGNLVFNDNASGELQNVFIERLAGAPSIDHTAQKGRIYFNTSVGLYYFSDGTAWQPFATGGNATLLQQYLNNLIASIGASVTATGTWNGAAFSGIPFLAGSTSITDALTRLAQEANSSDMLSELDDVTLSSPLVGHFLRYNGTMWVNHLPVLADISNVTATAAEVNVLAGIPATLTSTELGYVDGVTSPIQGQLDNKQALDATLTGLAALSGTGIVVETGVDAFNHRSLAAPAEGFTISNADGVSGNPTFALANDLAAVEGLAGTGYAVRTGTSTWTTRTIAGQTGRIIVANGDGVSTNTDIDLATVTQATSGTFSKITLDAYGRVVGNTDVTLADIKGLADGEYVNAAGDTMTGNLNMSGFTVTGLAAPVNGTDATTKNYVDALAAGMTWKNAVTVMSASNVDVATGGLLTVDGVALQAGDRVLLTAQTTATEKGIWVAAAGAWTRATDADVFAELNGASVFVQAGTNYADTGWVQTAELASLAGQQWVQFSGANTYTWGTGLQIAGNTVEVNLGAGIFEGPSDAIGIDLQAPTSGALMLTENGTDRAAPLSLTSKLHLLLAASGGLTQDASGLYVPANGITNAMILNDVNGLNADAGSGSLALGQTLLISGTAAQGIKTSVSGQTIAVTADDASASQKGVASFDANDFTVAAGAVSIKAAGVDNAQLANPYITFAGDSGAAQAVNLGQTVTFGDGGTHVDTGALVKTVASATNAVDFAVREATTALPGVASFNSADFNVTAGAVSAIAKNLDSLTDVTITSPAQGQSLVYSAGSSQFVNRPMYYLYDGAANTTHTVSHNLGQQYCNVTVVDASNEVVIPQSITFTSASQLTVTFTSSIPCKVIVMGVNGA